MIVLRVLLPSNSNLLKQGTVCGDFTNFNENLYNLWNFTFFVLVDLFILFAVADNIF